MDAARADPRCSRLRLASCRTTLGAEWNTRKAKIGDYAIVLKEIRNFVHAGAFVNSSRSRITRQRLEWCYEVFNGRKNGDIADILNCPRLITEL